jgi:hypothetical protein
MIGGDLLTAPSPAGQSWRDRINVHPAADLFEMMQDAELDALAADIVKNGVQQPIVWLKGQLLDGRNRVAAVYRISDEKRRDEIQARWQNGKSCIILPFHPDPYGYVVSANLHRRHLTAEQRREVIANLVKAQPEKSDRAIAKTAKVSDKTVGAVRAKLEATAEIPQLDKKVGADGKSRPAHKRVRRKPSTAPAPAQVRARAVIAFSTLLHSKLGDTLDDLTRILRDERGRITETIPHHKRVILARGYLDALGVHLDDLRPIEAFADNRAATASPEPPLAAAAPTAPKSKPAAADKPDLSQRIVATLKAMPGLSRTALNAKTHAYGSQIDQAIETGLIVERDGALFARGAA